MKALLEQWEGELETYLQDGTEMAESTPKNVTDMAENMPENATDDKASTKASHSLPTKKDARKSKRSNKNVKATTEPVDDSINLPVKMEM
jgi:hypothetical protein